MLMLKSPTLQQQHVYSLVQETILSKQQLVSLHELFSG